MILCFLAKISTYFSTFDYFFLSFFGCLMRWSDWDGLDEEKKARIYFPSCRCHHSCYAEITLVGITRRYLKQNAWISELLSNCLATFREPKDGKIVFLEAMEDWKWDWRQLSSPRLTVCPAHFVFALVSWPHWTGNEREGQEEVLSAGSAKIKLLERKKKKEVLEKTTMTKKSVCCPTHQLFADDQKLSDIRHHYLLSLWKCKIYCTQVTNKNRQKRRTLSVLFQRGGRSFREVGGGVCDLQEKNQNQLLTATNQEEGAGTGRGGGAKKNSFIFFQNKNSKNSHITV